MIKIIAAIKLPWIIVGDFNVPPDECAASVFYSYLGGTILAPNVDFTCVSSNGADRVLDYGICAPELADYIDIHPFHLHPCTPHVVAVDFHIYLDLQIDQGYVLDVPKEISLSCGPREISDTWGAHYCKHIDFCPKFMPLGLRALMMFGPCSMQDGPGQQKVILHPLCLVWSTMSHILAERR